MIELRLGRLEIDWGKNSFFNNHSELFRETDLAEAEYFYADGVVQRKPAYVRKLRNVIPRLDLLGFSLVRCKEIYENNARSTPSYHPKMIVSFEQFCHALQVLDIGRVSRAEWDQEYDLGEFALSILQDPAFLGAMPANLSKADGAVFENLDPYVVLRLLGENVANLDRELVWGVSDVLEGGWVEGEIFEPLAETRRFIIVTEGSSDSSILKAVLPVVAPDVDDFFSFIDMHDNYPFTGTGSLVNFCKGLAAIRVQNKIVVVLDNDSAGLAASRRLRRLKMPPNIRIVSLPDLDEFRAFPTHGPSGRLIEDVNGRAVAIECFLDLAFGSQGERAIRWTSFNSEIGAYQGELLGRVDKPDP